MFRFCFCTVIPKHWLCPVTILMHYAYFLAPTKTSSDALQLLACLKRQQERINEVQQYLVYVLKLWPPNIFTTILATILVLQGNPDLAP